MKNKKHNRYKNMKNALVASASGGIMAGMLIVGSGTAFAETQDLTSPSYTQNTSITGMHMMRRWNSPSKVSALANHLGLDPDTIREEIKSGKSVKQILQDNGIVPEQLEKAFKNSKKGMRQINKNRNFR